MHRGAVFICFALLIAFTLSASSADEQSFSITRKDKNFNHQPHVTVNSKSSDVLVAFIRTDPDDSDKAWVYTILCKMKKDGDLKPKKPVPISDANHTPEHLYLDFNPQANNYLVVWDAYTDDPCTATLFSRVVNARGKTPEGINELTEAGDDYCGPVIQCLQTTAAGPPAAKAYLLVYNYNPFMPTQYGKAGVYSAYLDPKGKITPGDPVLVSKPVLLYNIVPTRTMPLELLRTTDGGFMLGLLKAFNTPTNEPFLAMLDKNGKLKKEIKLCDYKGYRMNFIQLTKKLFTVTWGEYANGAPEWINQLFKSNLKKKKKEFTPLGNQKTFENELVKLEDGPGGYQLSSDGKFLKGRYVSIKGKLSKDKRNLFNHKCLLSELDAVCLPGGNRVFVAWVEIKTDDWSEIKGYVFKAQS